MTEPTTTIESAIVVIGLFAFISSFLWSIYWHNSQIRKYRYEPSFGCSVCDVYYRLVREYLAITNLGKKQRQATFERLISHWETYHGVKQ